MTTVFSSLTVFIRPAMAEVVDPFEATATDQDPFDTVPSAADRDPFETVSPAPSVENAAPVQQPGLVEESAPAPQQPSEQDSQPAAFEAKIQTPLTPQTSTSQIAPPQTATPQTPTPSPTLTLPTPFADDAAKPPAASPGQPAPPKDPCAAVQSRSLNELGINIAQPAGKLPTDLASPCWDQINQKGGPGAAGRCWPVLCYQWDATCFCHQPLYFEEINLERYGYQCGDKWCCATCGHEFCCLQPAASAAHFFGTIPALPYCMAAETPCQCIYTLGHYRPGDCNPWRWHWPPCDSRAALTTAAFYVGMIAAFP